MKISVLIPTYCRTDDLPRCLLALLKQTRLADQIIVITRQTDSESIGIVDQWKSRGPITLVSVNAPGVVAALNAGLAAVEGDIVAITDDDAAPRPDWLSRIESTFSSNREIGGVGGRDWIHHDDVEQEQVVVGRIQWFGRIVGNHHLGVGPSRDVDILKGVNMSFRMEALQGIQFDTRLRGNGAQVWNEMALSLEVKRNGWRLIYDPAAVVDHHPSVRHDRDQRAKFDKIACFNSAFNLYWTIKNCMSPNFRQTAALLWQTLAGTHSEPGIARAALDRVRGDQKAIQRWRCASAGRRAAQAEFDLIINARPMRTPTREQ